MATSRQDESPRLDALHPSLSGRTDLACVPFDADRVADAARVAFLALPHTASMAVVPALRARGVRVINPRLGYFEGPHGQFVPLEGPPSPDKPLVIEYETPSGGKDSF